MEAAKLFENGRSQAVRLPKKYRFSGDEVFIHRLGKAIILLPQDEVWDIFISGINSFTDDFMENGRESAIPSEREML